MAKKRKKAGGESSGGAEAAAPAVATEPGMSKMDAVRKALAEGVETPQDGVQFIRDRFGIEMSNAMFSSYKSNIGKKAGGGGNGRSRSRTGGGDNLIDSVKTVKELVERHGADTVREMIDLFE